MTICNKTKESLKQQNQSQDLEVTVEEGESNEKKMMKHAKQRGFYTICQESGLGVMVAKFGLKPEQFGDSCGMVIRNMKPNNTRRNVLLNLFN